METRSPVPSGSNRAVAVAVGISQGESGRLERICVDTDTVPTVISVPSGEVRGLRPAAPIGPQQTE